jgi:hypothetical protein
LGRSITTIGKTAENPITEAIGKTADNFIKNGEKFFRKNCNTTNKVLSKGQMADNGKDHPQKATAFQRITSYNKEEPIKIPKELPRIPRKETFVGIGMRRKFELLENSHSPNKHDQKNFIENINIGQTIGNTMAQLSKKPRLNPEMLYEKYYGQNGREEYDQTMRNIINYDGMEKDDQNMDEIIISDGMEKYDQNIRKKINSDEIEKYGLMNKMIRFDGIKNYGQNMNEIIRSDTAAAA